MRKTLSMLVFRSLFIAGIFASAPARDASPLVSVDWLNGHLSDKNLVVIEVHSGETKIKYTDEHIPGSVFASSVYFQKNMPTETNIPYDLPSKDEFEILARKLGITNDSRIVIVYPGFIPKDVMCATRTFWTFEYYGLSRVSILDGGLGAWKRASLAVDNITVSPKYGNLAVGDENHSVLATLEATIENFGKIGTVIIDSRAASDYIGKTKKDYVPEPGHIPGSISYFAPLFLNPDLTFKNAKQIVYETSLLDITSDKKIITYDNSGQFSTVSWFALKEIAGMEKVSSFDGSVSEWVNRGKRGLIRG
jgi:thiosulfate/3-mercaptopyruvate sulfurtransferase